MRIRPTDMFPQGEGSTLNADTIDGRHWRDIDSLVAALQARSVELEVEVMRLRQELDELVWGP